MLYHLFEFLEKQYDLPGAGLFQYITFRSGLAIIFSLIISIVFGDRIIRSLIRLQVGESIRDLGLTGQDEKAGTPTMGGFIILLAILLPCLLLAKLDNVYIILLIISTIWMASIGFVDDYIKVFRKNKDGLHGKFKIMGQVGLGLLVGLTMFLHDDIVIRVPLEQALADGLTIIDHFEARISSVNAAASTQLVAYVKSTGTDYPFLKEGNFDYQSFIYFLGDNASGLVWIVFVPIVIFIITGVSNASNLTDGIDGLAAGTSAIIAAVLALIAYVSENTIISDYLSIYYIPGAAEITIFASCFLGGCIGFLWYNSYPAKVFMGDTGSLMIGGIIGAMAILLRKEFLLPILCGIFFIETLSVMIQVGYFKYSRHKYGEGIRIFLMSPLHHHFQKKGMHESKIVVRFWIVGIILAILTIISFKIR